MKIVHLVSVVLVVFTTSFVNMVLSLGGFDKGKTIVGYSSEIAEPFKQKCKFDYD